MLAKKQRRGSGMFILDPESQILIFFHPGSRFQQQQKFYKIVNYLNALTGAEKKQKWWLRSSQKFGLDPGIRETYP